MVKVYFIQLLYFLGCIAFLVLGFYSGYAGAEESEIMIYLVMSLVMYLFSENEYLKERNYLIEKRLCMTDD